MDPRISSENKQLFPTSASLVVFWSYITLFVCQGLLVKAVQESQTEGFNAVIVVLLVETTKLLICVTIYILRSPYDGGIKGALKDIYKDINDNRGLLVLYLVPAFLYCLYNILTFINLELFDVSTYYCLMQFRIVLTAVIYSILFMRDLNLIQWFSLILLTLGCLIKEYGMYDRQHSLKHYVSGTNESNQTWTTDLDHHWPAQSKPESAHIIKFLWSINLLLIQMFCSCFAGVYNEYLLKKPSTTHQADIILHNIFMYIDSIICNIGALKLLPYITNSKILSTNLSLSTILYNCFTSRLIILLILNNALSGLVASFFLNSLNSILKTFASALELFAVTFLAWKLFDERVDNHTIVALILVSAATIIYSRHPVSVAPPAKAARVDNRNGFVLLRNETEG